MKERKNELLRKRLDKNRKKEGRKAVKKMEGSRHAKIE